MKIKFTITSHIGSYQRTFEPICKSLISSGVDPSDIYFFIGGFREYKSVKNHLGVNLYEASHNSIDLTGLISVIDLNLEADYWFLLHDTLTVGPNFYKKVMEANYTTNSITMTSDGLSMNIGAYSWQSLQQNKDQIMEIKNIDYSDEGLQIAKKRGIPNEDRFLYPKLNFYNHSARITKGPIDFYGNGVQRIVEYFPDIEIEKIKANWHIKNNYELGL